MSVKRKRGNTAWSIPGGIAAGLGISMMIALLGSALLAWLITGERLDISSIGYGGGLILILSSAVGAWFAAAKVKAKQLILTVIFACCYVILLLAVTALFFDGQYQGIGATLVCVFLGAGGMLLLRLLPKKASNKRHKIRAYR